MPKLTRALLALLALGMLLLPPASEAKMFTVDFNANGVNDLDGSDDMPFMFDVRNGFVQGSVRAVDLSATADELMSQVDGYRDFTGGEVELDFANMDVLIFDVTLTRFSRPLNKIGVRVTTDPLGLDPVGGGFLEGCNPGLPPGCANNVPGSGKKPDDIFLLPGGSFMPGAAIFGYGESRWPHDGDWGDWDDDWDKDSDGEWDDDDGNDIPWRGRGRSLKRRQTTRRLFVAWEDTGQQTPLSKDGQLALFRFGGRGNVSPVFETNIVPEPASALLLGFGVALLGWKRHRSR